MLPYEKLEDLLGALLADDEDEIVVLNGPESSILGNGCCKYNYGTYDPSGAPPILG